ncbi:hypothetical protein ANN_20776 [Periplaneta americana]|uniref:Transposable element Tc3 transposase n=1 Tax=Periplaneta americana TaxID=6978 RepID=A0ABQ8SDQ0_PERAM|nr:hypothetical protein ANN_20776 [Periplaneta americana]
MAGLCEGGNEPPGSLKAFLTGRSRMVTGPENVEATVVDCGVDSCERSPTGGARKAACLRRRLRESSIRPYLLPNSLHGDNYFVFLRDVLPELLENIPLNIRERIWFQHDGAPAHFNHRVRNHLNATFPDRWIGRGGPVPWPPRSPDLTPLDFFLWGDVKRFMYETPNHTAEDLVARVVEAAHVIRDNVGLFERCRYSIVRRYQLCNAFNGRQFEHHL